MKPRPLPAALVFLLSACHDDAVVRARGAASSPPRSDATATAIAATSVPPRAPTAISAGTAPSAGRRLPPLEPLRDVSWLEPLELPDGDVAFVSPPQGATEPRPIVLAVHGAHDRPEWACGGWRLGLATHPFVVCPRGTPVGNGKYAWSGAAALEHAGLAAVRAVRERFGEHAAAGPDTFAGFSQGATLAEAFLRRHAAAFPTAILAEGAYATLDSPAFARSFRNAGGKTVVIVCGTPGCRQRTARSAARLEAAGLRVFQSGDVRSGHNLNQAMQAALRRDFHGWFADDPAWQSNR